MNPVWETNKTEIDGDDVKITRYGHVFLEAGLDMKGIDPESFKAIHVSNKVPVQQGILVKNNQKTIITPMIIDLKRLRSGGYKWREVSYEAFENHG